MPTIGDEAVSDGAQQPPRKRFGASNIEEAVARWKSGETVWSIEMGGLGPGYEQAIQIDIFETLAEFLGPEKRTLLMTSEEKELNAHLDDALSPVSKRCSLGLSGAQAGAIKYIVYQFVKFGYIETLEKAGEDRRILVERNFPCVVEDAAHA